MMSSSIIVMDGSLDHVDVIPFISNIYFSCFRFRLIGIGRTRSVVG